MNEKTKVPQLRNLPDLLTVTEVAKVLRIGHGKAYMLVRTGDLPSVRLGKTLRVPKTSVEKLAFTTTKEEREVNEDEQSL